MLNFILHSDKAGKKQDLQDIQDALCTLNFSVMYICLIMDLCYNIALSVDLFITLYYPFISGNHPHSSGLKSL